MLEDTQIGPLVDQQGFAKVRAAVADAVAKGARASPWAAKPRGGLFFAPTVLTGVRRGMKVLDEETFGPWPHRSLPRRSGSGRDGQRDWVWPGRYLWTRDLGRAFRVAEALEYGLVGVNGRCPFGHGPERALRRMKTRRRARGRALGVGRVPGGEADLDGASSSLSRLRKAHDLK